MGRSRLKGVKAECRPGSVESIQGQHPGLGVVNIEKRRRHPRITQGFSSLLTPMKAKHPMKYTEICCPGCTTTVIVRPVACGSTHVCCMSCWAHFTVEPTKATAKRRVKPPCLTVYQRFQVSERVKMIERLTLGDVPYELLEDHQERAQLRQMIVDKESIPSTMLFKLVAGSWNSRKTVV